MPVSCTCARINARTRTRTYMHTHTRTRSTIAHKQHACMRALACITQPLRPCPQALGGAAPSAMGGAWTGWGCGRGERGGTGRQRRLRGRCRLHWSTSSPGAPGVPARVGAARRTAAAAQLLRVQLLCSRCSCCAGLRMLLPSGLSTGTLMAGLDRAGTHHPPSPGCMSLLHLAPSQLRQGRPQGV